MNISSAYTCKMILRQRGKVMFLLSLTAWILSYSSVKSKGKHVIETTDINFDAGGLLYP